MLSKRWCYCVYVGTVTISENAEVTMCDILSKLDRVLDEKTCRLTVKRLIPLHCTSKSCAEQVILEYVRYVKLVFPHASVTPPSKTPLLNLGWA